MFHVKYHLFSLFNQTRKVAVQSIGKYRGMPASRGHCKTDARVDVRNEIFAIGFEKRIWKVNETQTNK
jgi:hypothetical protein